jgi:alanine dehydrogenase
MIIGVPKEIKISENRVGLVEGGVRAFVRDGHTVYIERDAGIGSGITNEAYEKAGAKILDSAKEIYGKSNMVIKVKEPLPDEYSLLREDQIIYTYLHLAPDPVLTKALLDRKIKGVAYETIQLEDGSLPLLVPMSEVAGRMATLVGASYLQRDRGGKGVLLGGVPGVKRGRVTILGGGISGTNAAKMAVGLGAHVTILDISHKRLEYLDDIFQGKIQTLYSNITNIENAVPQTDLLIGAVLVPGAKAPHLVTRDMIKEMEPGSVVVDIAVDQGGCIETCRPTSHKEPTFSVDGVVHYCVPNMPGVFSRTSTYALTNTTLKYGLMLANMGVEEACAKDKALYKGLNVYRGYVSYEPVARDLNLPYKPLVV